VGRPNSSIAQPPEENAIVLAVVRLIRSKKKGESDTAVIYSHTCTFMPGETSLAVLNGFDDPKIAQTLTKLQDARAHPDPDPYGQPPDEQPARNTK